MGKAQAALLPLGGAGEELAGEKEYEAEKRVHERGVPVNANLRQQLQTMRDELRTEGYEEYF